jgi:hypothetical protein
VKKLILFVSLWALAHACLIGQYIYHPTFDQKGNYIGIFDVQTCKDSVLVRINTTGFGEVTITELAAGPNGELYAVALAHSTSPSIRYLVSIDLLKGTLTKIFQIPTVANSLTCSRDYVVFFAGMKVGSYDLKTGKFVDYGFLPEPAGGDLTFREGKLYYVTYNNSLYEINLQNLGASIPLTKFKFDFPIANVWGIVSHVVSCDSTVGYATLEASKDTIIFERIYSIYKVNYKTWELEFACHTAVDFPGAASPTESLASDCSVRLDLDADDSDNVPDKNWDAKLTCITNAVPVADTDALVVSGPPH